MSLQNLMEGYQPGDPPKVQRSGESYQQTYTYLRDNIERLVNRYRAHDRHDQTGRLIRDDIENALRRYHEYCIEQNLGAHYRQRGLARGEDVDFEHVIPAKVVRDALISGRMTVDQAFNVPTCDLGHAKHKELASRGMAKTTPCPFWFWRRYQGLGVEIETRQGELIDLETWNLDRHYEYFGDSLDSNRLVGTNLAS